MAEPRLDEIVAVVEPSCRWDAIDTLLFFATMFLGPVFCPPLGLAMVMAYVFVSHWAAPVIFDFLFCSLCFYLGRDQLGDAKWAKPPGSLHV